jgi:hypothetical protein
MAWVRCPACRTINAIDLRTLDRHHDAAITGLIPALSCRACRPHAPFAELVRLSLTSIADRWGRNPRRVGGIEELRASRTGTAALRLTCRPPAANI